ncbi:MAG: arylsulfatase [Acidimicrobiales bacterium]|nr:arylsulfatase [Acidimicrobiales bacterium]
MEPGQFEGTISRWRYDAEPWWPDPVRPAEDAPNVVVVLLDDVGFAQTGPYGSDIETPTIDRLAAGGLTFTNFHTTALCSPTRACLLTGRNHHSVGMGRITDLATGFPGYDATISRANGFLPEMLVPAGYAATMVGKWHLTPRDLQHLGADRTTWPLGRGFQRWYGFFEGENHQFGPSLMHDNHQVPPPGGYDDGYHLTEDMIDHAIDHVTDVRNADPDKPFLLYVAPGACHSPHQAPPRWLEHYRGRFDDGWDAWREACFERQVETGILPAHAELSARPDWVPAWDDLSDDERRVSARYMEAFAAMLSHTDEQLGRLVDHLETTGDLDNTLIMVLSDNGASSEGGVGGSLNDIRQWNGLGTSLREAVERIDEIGGPRIHNNYPWGWTVAGNTPFRRWKREVHEGGVADPLVVHWPAGIADRGELRHQYVHAIDLAPTVLEACGVAAPDAIGGVDQRPIEGVSLRAVLDDADADEIRTLQYYEMLGCRALYRDGMKAVTYHEIQAEEPRLSDERWELYDVRADPAENHDLAAERPDELAEMVELWWAEAEKHQVLPVDNRPFSEWTTERPISTGTREHYVYRPSSGMVPEETAADVRNRTHRVIAEVVVADGAAADGSIVSQGNLLGGWCLFADAGRLVWHCNVASRRIHRVDAAVDLTPGRHRIELAYDKTTDIGGRATLLVDGEEVATGDVSWHCLTRWSMTGAGLRVGTVDPLPPADDAGAARVFSGTIDTVTIEVDGTAHADPESDVATAIAAQ